MSALAPLVGMPVAFKLGTALGVFLLPLLVYASLRLMRLPFPAPLLGAGAALVFLYVEDNPIWGGTIASTLTGEFSYTYGVGLAILFLGVLFRARADGRGPWAPAAVLALTSYAHGYAVLWAGLTATGLLLCDPAGRAGRPWRTLGWLLAVAALAFAFAGPALVPLLADWGWTTPYDDAWISVRPARVLPAAPPPAPSCRRPRGSRRPLPPRAGPAAADARLLLLGFAALAAPRSPRPGPAWACSTCASCRSRSLSLALAGAAGVGLALARLALADVPPSAWCCRRGSRTARASCVTGSTGTTPGLEAKELWPAWRS